MVLAAALLSAPAVGHAATEEVKATAQADRTGARLVLEWQRPVEYAVTQQGEYIFVRFSRPLTGPLDLARDTLGQYLIELRVMAGGRVLVIRLGTLPRFAHSQRGNDIVLTWIGFSGASPPALGDPTDDARIPRRAAPDLSRPVPTPSGPSLKARSTAPQEQPQRPLVAPELQAEWPLSPKTGGTALKTPLAASEDPPARPAAPPAPRTEPPSSPPSEGPLPVEPVPISPESKASATPPRPDAPPEARGEPPAVPRTEAPVPAASASPRAEEAKPPPSLAKAPDAELARRVIRPAPEARPAPDAPTEPPAMPVVGPTLTVSNNGGETRIAFAWPEPVAAAVFRYGDHVWMIFPRGESFDVEAVQPLLGPGVERLTRVEHAQATVLAARAHADVRARVIHERNVWTVVLGREIGGAPAPDAKLAISRAGTERASVPLPGADRPIRLVTPEIGSTLHVVPSRALAALAGERMFVTFRLVPAVQGGVVEAIADGIVVEAESGALTIRRDGGLLMSNGGQHGQ